MLEGAVLERLIENPPFRINVSLYGGCAQTYQDMCGQNAFDRVVNNIRKLKEAGIDVRINFSITQYNRQDIEKIYQISRELDVHVKATSYMYPSIRTGSDFGCGNRLCPSEAAEAMVRWDMLRFTSEEFQQRAANMQKYIGMEQKECSVDIDEGVSCRAGHTTFWITWDGRMLPCGMMPGPTVYPLDMGFDAAWEELRARTKDIRMPPQCASCEKRDVCSVCAAVCVTETGAFDKVPAYMCQFTAEIVKETCRANEERMGNK
jgi:radical SAM protein with 4Fe4S-binding SPASM domain